MEPVAGLGPQLDQLRERGQLYLESLSLRDHPFAILDIAIVAIILYLAYRFVRGTKAASIVWGMVLVAVIFVVGRILQLDALNWLLRVSIPALLVAIPVIFQPELRRLLERLGRTQPWRTRAIGSRRRAASISNEIFAAVDTLAKSKTGALIVLGRRTGLDEYVETAQALDARLNSAMLLNIFFPNSPLHDGAVILRNDRILAAGATLPLSDAVATYQLGTRHKAALGISESSDALAIVVSEETGNVSVAFNGKLKRNIHVEDLREIINTAILSTATKEVASSIGSEENNAQ